MILLIGKAAFHSAYSGSRRIDSYLKYRTVQLTEKREHLDRPFTTNTISSFQVFSQKCILVLNNFMCYYIIYASSQSDGLLFSVRSYCFNLREIALIWIHRPKRKLVCDKYLLDGIWGELATWHELRSSAMFAIKLDVEKQCSRLTELCKKASTVYMWRGNNICQNVSEIKFSVPPVCPHITAMRTKWPNFWESETSQITRHAWLSEQKNPYVRSQSMRPLSSAPGAPTLGSVEWMETENKSRFGF